MRSQNQKAQKQRGRSPKSQKRRGKAKKNEKRKDGSKAKKGGEKTDVTLSKDEVKSCQKLIKILQKFDDTRDASKAQKARNFLRDVLEKTESAHNQPPKAMRGMFY